MGLPKMPGTLAGLAMGAAVAAGGAMPVLGAVAYEVTLDGSHAFPANSYIQQNGNGRVRYGDNVDLGLGAPTELQSIVLPLTLASYLDPTGASYQANLSLTVYNVDANGLPTTAIATSNVTHTFDNYNRGELGNNRLGVIANTDYVVFNFPGFVELPDQFAWGYRDDTLDADVSLQQALSSWAETNDPSDAFNSTQVGGDSPRRFLEETAPGVWALVARESQNEEAVEYNLVVAVNTGPVPEPASMALLSAGGLLLLRRRA